MAGERRVPFFHKYRPPTIPTMISAPPIPARIHGSKLFIVTRPEIFPSSDCVGCTGKPLVLRASVVFW
jgi:hypothetical protein